MTKFKKSVWFLCLLVCLAVLCAGCGEEPEPTTTAAPPVTNTNYTITVRTAGGMVPDDVTVYVYQDASKSVLVDLKKLDSEGKFSFVAPTSDQYAVVLEGVQPGYDVQEQYALTDAQLEIVLTSAPIAGQAPSGIAYELGDIIYDYTLTALDGQKYTISQLLQEKNAVMLNFWFVGCHYCMEEFPALQDAYAMYSDTVEVLALDVENDRDSEIKKVINQFGLTFPVAKVDASMLTAMKSGACPTTVIIDRYGMIAYIHEGDLTDPALFPALMRHFGAEDYVQAPVQNAADLVEEIDIPYGCEWYPHAVGALSEYAGEVRADELVYYTFYRISEATLRIEDPDIYLIYNGETYYPENGVLEMNFEADGLDSFSGVTVALGTNGGVDKEVILKQIPRAGTSENPYPLSLGNFTISGDGVHAYYSFTSEHTGTLTITIDSMPEGVHCRVNMTNMRTYAVTDGTTETNWNAEIGKYVFSIAVEAGDSVRLIMGTYGENPESIAVQAFATIPEVEGSGGSEEEPYYIVVTNESGTPVPGVTLSVTVGTETFTYLTDENGVAELDLEPGTYSMTLVVPEGYYATERYLLTPAKKDLNIVLVQARDYTVRVSITGTALTEVVTVRIYANDTLEELICEGQLDANGEVHFQYGYIDGCVAVLSGLPGNVYVQSSYPLTGELTQITLIRTSIGDTNASNQKYQLGDKISDFSITTPDGRTFTLSELLSEKKAVLLTFWHGSNTASVQGLNALQSIYANWSTQMEILAMNPLDSSDADISAFQGLYDLGFPVAQCSAQWESAFQMTVYPTLVMIDRDGTICFIHSGAVTDVDNLNRIFTRYTADDYSTTVVESIDLLLQENEGHGTQDKPYLVSQGTTELTITLGGGRVAYLIFEEQMPLSVAANGENVYMILGGEIYAPVDGSVMVILNVDGSQGQPVLVVGNSGDEAMEITITLTILAAG